MNKKILLLFLITFSLSEFLPAKIKSSSLTAQKTSETVKIDGILNESVWQNNPISGFIQKEPKEGDLETEKTLVWVVYDSENIYIAAKMFDSMPDKIDKSLARRDETNDTDLFIVYLDTYNDKRTGYYFGINPGGSILDGTLYNDSWDESRWDGIWESSSKVVEDGWVTEIRVPYSQLRFNENKEMTWGINFERRIKRNKERTLYVMVPSKEGGFVSHFASLEGLKDVKAKQRFEIFPYVVQKAQFLQHGDNDPYYKGNQYRTTFGADIKVSLGSNLNLDGTINPDFGQVEVDPAVLNLSAFETYYDEKRPFFLEGTTIFEFGWGGANNHWGFNFSWPALFYSRRIGQAPRGGVSDYDFISLPNETRILGAAKVTGKIYDNISIGALSAVTERTFAKYQLNGENKEAEVEPLTHFGVFRLQKEFKEGKHSIGMMVTSVNRDLHSESMKDLFAKNAFTYGIDGWITLDDSSTYVMSAAVMGSYKHGNTEYLSMLQKAPYRSYERPDATYEKFDPTRTSLSGWFGRVVLNKQKGNFYIYSSLGFVSPGFDYNDLGIQFWSNKINMVLVSGYRWYQPEELFRNKHVYLAMYRDYGFEGNLYRNGLMLFSGGTFVNYYSFSFNVNYNFETYEKAQTRGGPLVRNPANFSGMLNVSSDSRKNLIFSPFMGYWQDELTSKGGDVGFDINWKPSSALQVTIGPSLSVMKEEAQWVGKFDDNTAENTYGKRYVFAELNQTVIAANIRVNWTFSPEMSLQMFLQPLIAIGDYSEFKELAAASTKNYNIYGQNGSSISYNSEEGNYTVDPDNNGPAEELSFGNPDFNFKSLRGNIVFRWEFLPGSVFYLVWSHEQTNYDDPGQFDMKRDFKNLMNAQSDNIYMAKVTYWFDI